MSFDAGSTEIQTADQLFEQAETAMSAGDFAQAEDLWRQLLEFDRCNSDAFTQLGITLTQMGRQEDAIIAFQKALQFNPADALGYRYLGTAFQNRGNVARATAIFQLGTQFNPDDAVLHRCLGSSLMTEGDYAGAIAALQKALELSPGNEAALQLLSQAQQAAVEQA